MLINFTLSSAIGIIVFFRLTPVDTNN